MNETPEPIVPVTEEPFRDAADLERHLAGLESLLERGTALVRDERYDEFLELGSAIEAGLGAVARAEAPFTHSAFESIARIQKLHRELGLLLASRHDETSRKLAQMKTGKSVHKAYKKALS